MRKALALIIFVLATCGMAHAQTAAVRVKCGGPAYTDSKGQVWSADMDSNGGLVSTVTGPVSGTNDPTLFQDGLNRDHCTHGSPDPRSASSPLARSRDRCR